MTKEGHTCLKCETNGKIWKSCGNHHCAFCFYSIPLENHQVNLNGTIEKNCEEHGLPHIIAVPIIHADDPNWWMHSCCGCCQDWGRIK